MVTKTTEIVKRTQEVNLYDPNDILKFATDLKELIVQNNLYANIRGKNYIQVEGWQIAGAFTGCFPVVEKVENLSEGNNYKYRAEVSLRDKVGNIVGSGMAICTNKEPGKTNFDEYAVASMAQTRAVGKAFRLKIGWLLKIAGYETTPAEEMDTVVSGQTVDTKATPSFTQGQIAAAKIRLSCVKDIDELKAVWSELGLIRKEPEIVECKNKVKMELQGKD